MISVVVSFGCFVIFTIIKLLKERERHKHLFIFHLESYHKIDMKVYKTFLLTGLELVETKSM